MTNSTHNRTVLLVAAISIAVLLPLLLLPQPTVVSTWGGPMGFPAALGLGQRGSGIVGAAEPAALTGSAIAQAPGTALLEEYNQASELLEAPGDGSVRFYRREVAGGTLNYFVVLLGEGVSVQALTADDATPASDASGDTVWAGGGKHLATVQEMATAPYAALPGHSLLGATNFGFFGARTSSEGTVVTDGMVRRVNRGRGALCIMPGGRAEIGVFDEDALERLKCQEALGAGPVFLWKGKIANPAVQAETAEFLPFNPLGEDFVQLDWRRTAYATGVPKTAVCVGNQSDGRSFLVMATSYGVPGVELAGNLRAMGCVDALGADDDTSTQMVWRGTAVVSRAQREVPDALAVYIRE
jgi:hypothetical protein